MNPRQKMRLERTLVDTMARDGLRGAERFVAELVLEGRRFELAGRGPGYRRWALTLEEGRREVTVAAWSHRGSRMASVQVAEITPLRLTPRQARIDALQRAFYARYTGIGQKAYGPERPRLRPMDRKLLLLGDFEAGVNNGGFSTYLFNKGRRVARSALAALEAIGARKTASLLRTALTPGIGEAALGKLDDRFYNAPEDLARLAAEHAKLPPLPR